MLSRSMFGCLFILLIGTACQYSKNQEECPDCSYVHSNGVEVEADHWVQCGRNGQVISSLHNGSRITQTYVDGLLDGESTCTFPNSSQIQHVENYSKDRLVSQSIFDESGMPRYSIVYSEPEMRTITSWYANGGPKSVEKLDRQLLITGDYYTPGNQRDSWVYDGKGERIARDDEGNFVSLDTFHCGELVMKTHYYATGHPMEIAPYSGGLLHGERKTYYPGGEPMAIETWHGGQQSGLTTIFQNGEKYSEISYLNNQKNGLERRFRDGTFVTQDITWLEGQMHGPAYTYTGDNETMLSDWFYKGRLTSRANFESFGLPKPNAPESGT